METLIISAVNFYDCSNFNRKKGRTCPYNTPKVIPLCQAGAKKFEPPPKSPVISMFLGFSEIFKNSFYLLPIELF